MDNLFFGVTLDIFHQISARNICCTVVFSSKITHAISRVSAVQIIGDAGNKKCNTGSVHKLSESDSDFLTLAEVSRLLFVYLHLRQLLIVHLLSLLPPNTIRVREKLSTLKQGQSLK